MTDFTGWDVEISYIESHYDIMDEIENILVSGIEQLNEDLNMNIPVPKKPFPKIPLLEAKKILAEAGVKSKKDYIIVTEGITDVWRLGDDSCCTFGKNYKFQQIKLLKKYKKIYIFYDPDEAGQKSAKNLGYELELLGCKTYNILGECDPGDLSNLEINKLKEEING